jgi:RNA polymerase sigma-70 factor (ECF subfamily)
VSETLHTLVQAARHNDESAWNSLFRRYQLPLFTYAHGLAGNREAAFDIVQETFIRAAAHVGGLRDDARFGSWIFGIAHQRCISHFRSSRRNASLFSDAFGDGMDEHEGDLPDPCLALLSSERAEALFGLIDQLPLPQRSALLLHVLGDLTLEEIAGIASVPLGTVKSRMHHAKRALRILIEKENL